MNEKQFIRWLDNFREIDNFAKKHIVNLIKKVGKITQESFDNVLKGVDFEVEEKTIEKLEAMLGELRAISFLNNIGFVDIKLLPSKKKNVNPDISAKWQGKEFVGEVACLTKKHSRKKIPELKVYGIDDDKFVNTLKTISQKKKRQLDAIKNVRKILIFIINRSPDVELHALDEYKTILKKLNSRLKWNDENYYFAIVTGNEVNGKLCDIIYPAL